MTTKKAGDAAYRVLAEEGKPLHYKEIALIAIGKGYWETDSSDPEAAMNMALNYEVRERNGHSCRFKKTGRGWFILKHFTYPAQEMPLNEHSTKPWDRIEVLLAEIVKEVGTLKNAS